MPVRKIVLLGMVCLLSACSRTEKPVATTQPALPSPSPSMSPGDVVRTVVLAMQHNDTPQADAGIMTAFRFASPANRRITGPIEQFIPLVKSPAYASLINFKSVNFSPIEIRGNEARLMIKIVASDEQAVIYGWTLSKQDEGEFAGCWMTDQVVPLQPVATQPPRQQGADDDGKTRI